MDKSTPLGLIIPGTNLYIPIIRIGSNPDKEGEMYIGWSQFFPAKSEKIVTNGFTDIIITQPFPSTIQPQCTDGTFNACEKYTGRIYNTADGTWQLETIFCASSAVRNDGTSINGREAHKLHMYIYTGEDNQVNGHKDCVVVGIIDGYIDTFHRWVTLHPGHYLNYRVRNEADDDLTISGYIKIIRHQ